METEQIVTWVLSILPSLIAVLSTVGLVIKTIRNFNSLKKEVTDMKAMEEVKEQLKMVLKENYELKYRLDKTIAKMNNIYYPEDNKKE